MLRRLFAVLLFALAVSAAQPAHASTLTVGLLSCEGIGGGNTTARFYCEGSVSGGVGGNTYTWSMGGTQTNWADGSSLYGYCRVGKSSLVQFTVRDSSGATASASTTFYCYSIAP